MCIRDRSVTNAEDDYKNYYRMNQRLFDTLLSKITPYLSRRDTVMRDCLSVEARFVLTLRFLATARNFEDLMFSVIISPSAISQAVFETCEALIFVLQDYMKVSKELNY